LARSRDHAVSLYSEEVSPEAISQGFGLASGDWDPLLLNGVDLVVTSPGFPERSLPIVESLEWGIPVWSEIEFAYQYLDVPVAAITGTNGKTSVTEAASAMLVESGLVAPAVGNIGSPLSDHVGQTADALVVEVSSFQLRFIETFHPEVSVITNVALDHLDWHGSETSYRAAKARVFENQTSGDLLVYDSDDAGATSLAATATADLFPVSGTGLPPNGGGLDDGHLLVGDVRLEVSDLRSVDSTHLVNLAAAAALSLRMGASAEGISEAARRFSPGQHRRSEIARFGGIAWVNDSKATNVHAAVASIRANDSVILIAGGLAKGIDLGPMAKEENVRELIGIGEAGPRLVEMAGDRGHMATGLEQAVSMAADLGHPGDTVLLAPGCASFDQFESYEARGERFTSLVGDLEARDQKGEAQV
jgi:UDP-N-acetylmuramoylalanine--D-glutamate ligase